MREDGGRGEFYKINVDLHMYMYYTCTCASVHNMAAVVTVDMYMYEYTLETRLLLPQVCSPAPPPFLQTTQPHPFFFKLCSSSLLFLSSLPLPLSLSLPLSFPLSPYLTPPPPPLHLPPSLLSSHSPSRFHSRSILCREIVGHVPLSPTHSGRLVHVHVNNQLRQLYQH